jgi:hypothetical protein
MGNGFRDSGNRELYTFEAFYGTNSEIAVFPVS